MPLLAGGFFFFFPYLVRTTLGGSYHFCFSLRGSSPSLSPCCQWFGKICLFPLAVWQKPLGQTVPCLLIPPANRIANSQRSPGCSGQAEMPYCLGVSSPRQVVPGLHLVFICLTVVLSFILRCVLIFIFLNLCLCGFFFKWSSPPPLLYSSHWMFF